MKNKLTNKQQLYYDERCDFFQGMGIATPYGLIQDEATKMTDVDCDKWFESGIPKEWLKEHGTTE